MKLVPKFEAPFHWSQLDEARKAWVGLLCRIKRRNARPPKAAAPDCWRASAAHRTEQIETLARSVALAEVVCADLANPEISGGRRFDAFCHCRLYLSERAKDVLRASARHTRRGNPTSARRTPWRAASRYYRVGRIVSAAMDEFLLDADDGTPPQAEITAG